MNKNKKETNLIRDKRRHETFGVGKYQVHSLKSHSVRFAWLYLHHSRKTRYALAALIGILMAFFVQVLIKNTGLYNTGISAVTQGIARIVNGIMQNHNMDKGLTFFTYNMIFWGFFFIINIPLFILSYKKIGKTFTGLSFTYIFFETAFGFVFSSIPNIEDVLIFGDPRASSIYLADGKEVKNWLVQNGLNVLPISYGSKDIFASNGINPLFLADKDPIKNLYIILSAIGFGFASAACYSVLYIIGGCSCGADFISFYYSVAKQKSVNKLIIIINMTLMIIGVLTGSYIASGIIEKQCWNTSWLWSGTFLGSFINIFIFKIVLNLFYPSSSQVMLHIYSNKYEDIANAFKQINYNHTFTIYQAKGSYKGNTQYVMQSICMFSESSNIIYFIRQVDPECMITITRLKDVDGRIRIQQTGSVEK